jgi:hypothetical protein
MNAAKMKAPSLEFKEGAKMLQQANQKADLSLEVFASNSRFPGISRRVNNILKARRQRNEFLPGNLFADPAWDILLHLYASSLSGQRATVTTAMLASCVPETTGLRWVNALVEAGLCSKSRDALDKRRCFVALTERGEAAMNAYFESADNEAC